MAAASTSSIQGPHRGLAGSGEQERLASELFDRLWDRYRSRVSYVQDYEKLIQQQGATFFNDHIAFRTFACQRPTTGIVTLARVFESLGYCAAATYMFPDKGLNAIHYQHPNARFPKIFISELRVWELSTDAQEAIHRTVQSHREPLADQTLAALAALSKPRSKPEPRLIDEVLDCFHRLPWDLPEKEDVQAVNQESQYAAWVMVHGYNVNHFTSLINSHGVTALNDIEKTIEALRDAGVPMKAEIEGERGSKLRQSATEAVRIDVEVKEHGRPVQMPWSYAYFELAERGEVADPQSGRRGRFEGFLGPQATNLFEMTRTS